MLNKKEKTKKDIKCPFRNLKECTEECAFYRKGVLYNEVTNQNMPFEECAINIIANNLEAMHSRTFMLQKEVGETKNVMAFKILSELGRIQNSEVERQALKIITPPDVDKKLLK